MPVSPVGNDRIRAWIFVYFEDPAAFQKILLQDLPFPSGWVGKKFYEVGGDEFVIVRADEIETIAIGEQKYNFVLPVDAKDDRAYTQAIRIITDLLDNKNIKEVKVIDHNPWPPHKAHGFITENEFIEFADEKVGRQYHKSPGSNKWG